MNEPRLNNFDPRLSGEERRRQMQIVDETLANLGIALSKPSNTKDDESLRRMLLANQEVMRVVKQHYDSHIISTNLPELKQEISRVYLEEFSRWTKDELLLMLTMNQTTLALQKLGY